jgi:hypothetical protein
MLSHSALVSFSQDVCGVGEGGVGEGGIGVDCGVGDDGGVGARVWAQMSSTKSLINVLCVNSSNDWTGKKLCVEANDLIKFVLAFPIATIAS